MSKELANLLFPNITKTPADWLKKYPRRNSPAFRFAPSPTGFLHLGSLGAAMCGRMLANAHNGVFYLRIEDTDQKREVAGATELLVKGLSEFGITFDEGFDGVKHFGKYAPYRQSERTEIYHSFAKDLVERGFAYPCFCTASDLEQTRDKQKANKEDIGYHGKYAVCSKRSVSDIKKLINSNQEWVLRFLPQRDAGPNTRVSWEDGIRGKLSLPSIINNPVIIKSNGIPPYNFAHVVDDLLMGTSHVVRGEEWLSSTAEHIQLALAVIGNVPWSYSHLPVISIEDNGKKRKLSKRKDKFALAEHFISEGYPKEAIIEYLMMLYNTDYEMWRIKNPSSPVSEFNFSLKKIGVNNPLFDVQKLNFISREIIASKSTNDITKDLTEFFKDHKDLDKIVSIMCLDRETPKPRKDISKLSDILVEYDYLFKRPSKTKKDIFKKFLSSYNHSDDRETWFSKIKELGSPRDIMPVLRLALTGKTNSPDLYPIMQILGEAEVIKRYN